MTGNRHIGGLALLLALAACETGTEPGDPTGFDADRVVANHEAFDRIVTSDGLESFEAAAASFQTEAPEVLAAFDAVSTRAGALDLAQRLAMAGGTAARVPVISESNRGVTWVYVPEVGEYQPDPERTGAPANGIRFILYELDEAGDPRPDMEIGHADVLDEGEGQPEDGVLRLLAVVEGRTILDYLTSVEIGLGSAEVTVDGFLHPEDDRLDFDLDLSAGDGGRVDLLFSMSIAARDFEIAGAVHAVEEDEEGTVDLTVRHGTDSFRVDVEGDDTSIDGTVYVNGTVLALVTGDPDDPTITDASGGALTASQLHALGVVVQGTAGVFALVGGLLAPVAKLVLLAILL